MAENNVSARMLFPIYPGSKYVPFQSIIDDFYNSVYRCYRLEERGKYKENMDQSHTFNVSRHLIVNGNTRFRFNWRSYHSATGTSNKTLRNVMCLYSTLSSTYMWIRFLPLSGNK